MTPPGADPDRPNPPRQSDRLAGIPAPEPTDPPIRLAPNSPPLPECSLTDTPEQRRQRVRKSISSANEQTDKPMDTQPEQKEAQPPEQQEDQPIQYDDPEPIRKDATEKEKAAHRALIHEYTNDMLAAYINTSFSGESLWFDFCTAFRPQTIKLWTRPMLSTWADFLTKRDIHVAEGKRRPRDKALIELLYREHHIPARKLDQMRIETRQASDKIYAQNNPPHEHPQPTPIVHQEEKETKLKTDAPAAYDDSTKVTFLSANPDYDGDDGEGSTDDEEDKHPKLPALQTGVEKYEKTPPNDQSPVNTWPQDSSRSDNLRGLGIHGLVRAFQKEDKYGGQIDEDLEKSIRVFNTLARMCEVNELEKMQAIPVMLKGDALDFFAENDDRCTTYNESLALLRTWYHSDEQRARVLAEWQQLRLTEEMARNPESSEQDVFRKFTARLRTLQKQLDKKYHGDGYLVDRLLTAVDVPTIQAALKDRMPRTAQQAIHRISNRLSEKPRTAGAMTVALVSDAREEYPAEEAMYSLGKRYGGEAKRTIKPYRRPAGNGRGRQNTQRGRQIRSSWLRGVRGCFVCGEAHRANERHPREEVTAAIRRLKDRHPTALITVEDLDAIYNMDAIGEGQAEELDEEVQWVDEDRSETESVFLCTHDAEAIEENLSDNAYSHGCQAYCNIPSPSEKAQNYQGHIQSGGAKIVHHKSAHPDKIPITTHRSAQSNSFKGIRLDTCANRRSVMSVQQYEAYCMEFCLPRIVIPTKGRQIRGIGGIKKGIGQARIQIPLRDLGIIIDVNFLLLEDPIPSLLSMKDMLDNQLDLSIQGRYLSFGGRRQALEMRNYFLIYSWKADDQPYIFYTTSELQRLHSTFGHPSVRSTRKLLERASGKPTDPSTTNAIQQIADQCKICAKNSAAPRRFRLTIGSEELRFNHEIEVDTMWIDGQPVVHIIDKATHFSAAMFVKRQRASDIWNAIQRMWLLAYCGPPDFLAIDQGSNYSSKEFRSYAAAEGIKLREAPIETPGAIGTVERYHAPLRRAYTCIRQHLPSTTTNPDCLAMAVFSINSVVGPEGLCPMILVYGALPRPARVRPAGTQLERAEVMEKAKAEVQKEHANRRIKFGLRNYMGPKGGEKTEKLLQLPVGAPVWVYRTTPKGWQGPFKFISVEKETAVIQLPRGRRIFRTTCVRPYNTQSATPDKAPNSANTALCSESLSPSDFATTRTNELHGLLNNGTFRPANKQEVPDGMRIFGSRFIDELKRAIHGSRKKSRLVAQNYSDAASAGIATKAPTIQRFSQRLLLALAASHSGTTLFSRDVTQAYVQSKTTLEREVYIRAPAELGLGEDMVLRVMKPLYGIPESGLHWYLTYLEHHLKHLGMHRTRADPCLLVKRGKEGLEGMIALQVDDTLGFGTKIFLQEEEKASARFKSKTRNAINDGDLTFNGMTLTLSAENTISAIQTSKITGLKQVSDQQSFTSVRALAQYIGVCTRPDVCAGVQLLAPGTEPTTPEEMKQLNKATKWLQATKEYGLRFRPLDLDTTKIVVISDASFGNARGYRSQLGFVILLADASGTTNIVHFASNRCKRVTRSVLAAEVHGLLLAFDAGIMIQDMLTEILGRQLEMDAYVDSRTLFHVVAKDGATTEKRLQIDIASLRESYERGELRSISWMPGKRNPADGLTKEAFNASTPLWSLMTTCAIDLTALGWATTSRKREKVGV